ncbi:RNA-guided endonuclease InsQ/TnpB family protein [Priestia taiwanensis]|uniref:Transposase n=1 Tax=Priestia taiwanensis TaxID=1347902 RepID=A0A917AJ36_9BACI|nr:RNA-guided endonuclease TnpB family protein [Priestia taiwanensis]MBM7361789.1 putative transposase [Priestia taiwanensis]GGE57027.1 transposase [Priestia taiwanensis]
MILAKKIRIVPTKEQEIQLWKSAGTARFTYNWALAKQQENYKQGGKFIPHTVLRKIFTKLKQVPEYAWLYDVSNNVAKQAMKDLCSAYANFFKGLADKPRFKSRRRSKPSFYNDTDKLKVKEKLVLIEKVGWVKTVEQLPIGVKYTNPRVSFDGKYWYIAVGFEQILPNQTATDVSLGIDVGIKELAVCSSGKRIKNINKKKKVKQVEKRLRMLQRQVSRKYEMNKEGNRFVKTSNIIKIEKRIRHLHRKLTNIRTNHLHQATNDIVKTKPYRIVMETLNSKGMMKNKHLSKAINEQKLYEFKKQIQYKCEKYGIEFIEADKWYPSSKMCSTCGKIKKDLKLSNRVYRCICGHEIDRDLNAAINLSRYQLA